MLFITKLIAVQVDITHLLLSKNLNLTRSALFWDITRRRVVIVYRRFGITYRSFTGQESEFLPREDGTDTLSRNVGKQLSHDAA